MRSCPYPTLFENRTPQDATKLSRYPFTPNPFVLEPEDLSGEKLNLGVVLFGRAAQHFSAVSIALKRAGENGLTEKRVKLSLQGTTREQFHDAFAWTNALHGPAQTIESHEPPECVRVRLLTPLRIKEQGHFVGAKEFRFRAFAANLLRRMSLLAHFFGGCELEADFRASLRRAEEVRLDAAGLVWRDQTRFSSRQKARMKIGGLIGEFDLSLDGIEFLWPCLVIGQWTHVGKNCTFGLGRYVLDPVRKPASATWPSPACLQEPIHDTTSL